MDGRYRDVGRSAVAGVQPASQVSNSGDCHRHRQLKNSAMRCPSLVLSPWLSTLSPILVLRSFPLAFAMYVLPPSSLLRLRHILPTFFHPCTPLAFGTDFDNYAVHGSVLLSPDIAGGQTDRLNFEEFHLLLLRRTGTPAISWFHGRCAHGKGGVAGRATCNQGVWTAG